MNDQVKLGFKALSIPSKIQKGRGYVMAMANNPTFRAIDPDLETVKAAVATLETAYQDAADGGKSKKQIMNDREAELDILIAQLGASVQAISKGNGEIIRSAGFEVRATHGPIGDLNLPLRLRATTSPHSGEAILDWKPVHGAGAYIIEKSDDGNTGWQPASHVTGSHATISALTPTSVCWFRVAGIGAAGQGPWSDPVKALIG